MILPLDLDNFRQVVPITVPSKHSHLSIPPASTGRKFKHLSDDWHGLFVRQVCWQISSVLD